MRWAERSPGTKAEKPSQPPYLERGRITGSRDRNYPGKHIGPPRFLGS